VTIRYDDWDEDVSVELLQEVFEQCKQVRVLIIAALPESVRP
jgi:hypothetical protein